MNWLEFISSPVFLNLLIVVVIPLAIFSYRKFAKKQDVETALKQTETDIRKVREMGEYAEIVVRAIEQMKGNTAYHSVIDNKSAFDRALTLMIERFPELSKNLGSATALIESAVKTYNAFNMLRPKIIEPETKKSML